MAMLGCASGSLVMSVSVVGIATYVAASFGKRLRKLEYETVQSFSSKELNEFSTPSLITRSTNDITQVQLFLALGLQVLIKAPITATYAISIIVEKNWDWTVVTLVGLLIVILTIGIVLLYVIPRFRKVQWLTDGVNRVTRENITGIRVVRAYNAESFQEAKSDVANEALTDNNLTIYRSLSLMMPMVSAVMNLVTLAIYWVGAIMIDAASTPAYKWELFSEMIVFTQYALQVLVSFVMLIGVSMQMPRAMVAAKRIEEVIETKSSIVNGDGANPTSKGIISFKNVSFRYPKSLNDTISNISFDVKQGETVALIGPTGSGKTTLVDLIPRFADATEGSVEVNGVDVRDYDLKDLRSRIGYVSQKTFLASGTVESNVNYGNKSTCHTEDDVRKALKMAQADGFVNDLEMRVSQGGINFSGGQKQRISIARALCWNPEIYIFDDSFSALDYNTDRILRKTLEEETKGSTVLIVAQRIGTIKDADRIIVMDEGRIVGMGRHEELLRNCGTYLEIARSQLSEKELGL